jgi:hypothetical protein
LAHCVKAVIAAFRLPSTFFSSSLPKGDFIMRKFTERLSSGLRAALIAVTALAGVGLSAAAFMSPAYADSGTIRFTVLKGGWFVGASGGSGSFTFHGRTYPISVGGISAGLVFGASETRFRGVVTNIRRASDVAGVYGAVGAGGALGAGAQVIRLRNEKGAILEMSGRQIGLQVNADLSGLSISLR